MGGMNPGVAASAPGRGQKGIEQGEVGTAYIGFLRGRSFSGLRFPDLTVGESPSSRFGELKNWWVYLFMVWWVFVGSSEIGRFSGSGIGGFFFFSPSFSCIRLVGQDRKFFSAASGFGRGAISVELLKRSLRRDVATVDSSCGANSYHRLRQERSHHHGQLLQLYPQIVAGRIGKGCVATVESSP